MKKIIILLVLCIAFTNTILYAGEHPQKDTDTNIFGHVLDAQTKEHLPYVTLQLKGTTIGTTTDASGHYLLKNLPTGKFTIVAQFVGYQTVEKEVVLKKETTIELDFELKPMPISLDEVVVSANRNETSRRLAPSLVSILDMKTFEVTNSTDLSQGLKFQPGLRVENNCQNCGFSQVRINGLEGPYSQILIDSRPVVGALAGVYGLEQIPANMVERVEVMRGGGSALFGSSAIGGVINIITKEPLRNSGEFGHTLTSYNGTGALQNNTTFNASILTDNRKAGLMVFGQNRVRDGFDYDKDEFTELPQLKSRTLGFRSFLKTGTYSQLVMEYRNMHEFRRGGDNLTRPPHEAYIAEQLEHSINGGSLNYKTSDAAGKNSFNLYASAQHTLRNSYYGGGDPVLNEFPEIGTKPTQEDLDKIKAVIDNNEARLASYGHTTELTAQVGGQYTHKFNKLLFMPSELTAGAEYLQNNLNDVSGYRKNGINQITRNISTFLQNEWKNEQWSFLLGGRLDKHNLVKNVIFSPRANVRYNPIEDVNIRLSYSEGFRAPQYFDEDLHVDIAGGERLVRKLSPDLREEHSRSISGSVDFYHNFDNVQLNLLIEGFYTRLKNPFTSVTKGNEITVENSQQGANVYGVNLEGRLAFGNKFQLQSGATFQRSLYDDARKWWEPETEEDKALDKVEATRRMMRTPNTYAYFVATWTPVTPFQASLSGNYTGSMLVPHDAGEGKEGIDRFSTVNITEKTKSFMEMNLKLAYTFALYKEVNIQVSGGIQNMFNAFQNDFDTGAGRASAYVYGPISPRNYYAGLKISF